MVGLPYSRETYFFMEGTWLPTRLTFFLYLKAEVDGWVEKGQPEKGSHAGPYRKVRHTFVRLFWPKKSEKRNWFPSNTRAIGERHTGGFKLHTCQTSYAVQYANRRREEPERSHVLSVEECYAPYQMILNVNKFIWQRLMLKMKMLPKSAPSPNPVEAKMNNHSRQLYIHQQWF